MIYAYISKWSAGLLVAFCAVAAVFFIAVISIILPLKTLLSWLIGLGLLVGVMLNKQGFLYLILFLAAFEWMVYPKDGTFLYYFFEVVIVAVAVARVFFKGEEFVFPPSRLFAPVIAFVVWVLFTVVFAVDVSLAASTFVIWMASVVTFFLSYLLIDSHKAMRSVLKLQVIVAILFAAASLYERAATGSRTIDLGHINVNVLGNYAFQASSVALMTVGYLKGRFWKFASVCCLAAMVVALYLSYSRGAMLAFLAFSAVYLALAGYKRLLKLGIAAAAIGLLFVVTSHYFLIYFEDISRSLRLTAGLTMRDDLWWSALLLIKDYPLTGVGIGCIKVVYAHYVRLTDPRFIMMAHTPVLAGNVHNGYLAVLAQFGLIGFALNLWAIFVAAKFIPRAKKSISEIDTRLLLAFVSGVFSAVLLRAFYEATMAVGFMVLSSLLVVIVGGALRLVVEGCSESNPAAAGTNELDRS